MTAWQSSRGELVLGPGELGEKVKLKEPRGQNSCCPTVRGQPLEVSYGGQLPQHPSLTGEPLALEDHMFSCLPLPPTGARRGVKAGDPAAVEKGSKANLACADLCQDAGVCLR